MNRRRPSRGFLMAVVLGALAAPAWGECPTCGWGDRGDRYEGVASRQTSGGCCEVLGVHYQRSGQVDPAAPRLSVFFWLPAAASPEIIVWQQSTNYMMVPKSKAYTKGLQRFSWPRETVIDPLGVSIDSLYTRVFDSRELHYPALLGTGETPGPAGSYVFILESGSGIDASGTIERESGGTLTPIRRFDLQEEFGGVFPIAWDGLDDHGQPVPAGTYVLRLAGQQEGEEIEPLNFALHFQHYVSRP